MAIDTRLLSFEFIGYYATVAWFLFSVFPASMARSRTLCFQAWSCRRFLRKDNDSSYWRPQAVPTMNDRADNQWRDFREALPLMAIGACAYMAASMAVRTTFRSSRESKVFTVRVRFSLAVSLGFIAYVHGAFAVLTLAIVCLGWGLARLTSGGAYLGPVTAWAYCLAILAVKEKCNSQGYRPSCFGSV